MRIVSTNSYEPLYIQIKRIIIDRIQSGVLQPNEQLPTENELCAEFGVSKSPVRQALTALADENYIYMVRGKGSYVLSGYVKYKSNHLKSFTEEIISLGHEPGTRFIKKQVTTADAEIAQSLSIEEGDPVLCAVRLRTVNGEIYSLNYSYFSIAQFPEVETIDFSVPSLSKENERILRSDMSFATVVLEATSTTRELSHLMQREVGSPLLLMSRTTFYRINQVEKPYEFVRVYFVPDKYKFEVTLTRK